MNSFKRTQNKYISCKIYQFWNIFLRACFELIYLRKCIALSHSVHDFGPACFSVFVVIYKSSFARDKIQYSARKKSHQSQILHFKCCKCQHAFAVQVMSYYFSKASDQFLTYEFTTEPIHNIRCTLRFMYL